MTQLETLKTMREILTYYGSQINTNATTRLGSWGYSECLSNLDQMIKVRTKTPEQREAENARKRQRNAEKRAKRDAEIFNAINPYLVQPRTATELVELTGHAFKAGEIRSYFDRHSRDGNFEFVSPRTEWAYKARV